VRFLATGDPATVSRGSLTLSVIRRHLTELVASRMSDDPNLHYLDGHDLYGPSDVAEHPLPDNLHPDAATHVLIARRFADVTFSAAGPFGRAERTGHGDRSPHAEHRGTR
jgi:hypothetical protein